MSRKHTFYIAYFVIILLMSVLLIGESLSWFSGGNSGGGNIIGTGDFDFSIAVEKNGVSFSEATSVKNASSVTMPDLELNLKNTTMLGADEFFDGNSVCFYVSVQSLSDSPFDYTLSAIIGANTSVQSAAISSNAVTEYFYGEGNYQFMILYTIDTAFKALVDTNFTAIQNDTYTLTYDYHELYYNQNSPYSSLYNGSYEQMLEKNQISKQYLIFWLSDYEEYLLEGGDTPPRPVALKNYSVKIRLTAEQTEGQS